MPKSLKIAQGGIVLDIRAEDRCDWIIRELGRRWRFFVTDAAPVDVNVRICFYDSRQVFPWPSALAAPFSRLFGKIIERYPFGNGDDGAPCPPEKILTRLDPEKGAVKHIAKRLSQNSGIIYANTAGGLFFFDPSEATLHIFTRHAPPPLPLFAWFSRTSSRKRAILVADITNGIVLAVSCLLVQEGGLLLHGTGLGKSGAAVLFMGLSGAGKSTVARMCPAEACFADDGVIIKKTESGISLHPSVFMQAQGYWRRPLPRPMELRKLFLLKKSDQNRVTPLDKSYLMNYILLHLIHFFRYFNQKTAIKAFENTRKLVDAVPAFRLDFTKTRVDWSDVWQTVEKRKSTNHRS